MVEVMRERKLNRLVARQKGVKAVVRQQAEEIYAIASGRLAAHRDEYQAKLEVSSGNVDSIVTLIDPAALSIEFGHYAGARGQSGRTWVEGVNMFRGYRYKDGVI